MSDEMYHRGRIDEILGRDLFNEFREIEALLELIDYRMETAAGNTQYALLRLFNFDTLFGKKTSTQAIAKILSPALWTVSKIKHRRTKKADPRPAFSNTFLLSDRYPAAREAIEKDCGCTAVLAFTDMLKLEGKNRQLNLKASLRPEQHQAKPVFFAGNSIIGGKLQKAVAEYCETVYNPAGEKDETAVRKALTKLREAYPARVKKMEDCLRREDCLLYMTVNMYNLRDLLIIHACKNLGIRTLQQEHHATQFNWQPYSEERKMPRLALAAEYGFWSKTEQLVHEKVYRYESPLYRPEEIRFRVTGNPEISREKAEEFRRQYKPRRRLTFMMASLQDHELEGRREQYEQWRWKIFNGLRELARKQKIEINVRYSPNTQKEYREKEEPILKEWGFRISKSVPENLMEDLMTSVAILSSTSSVMATARLMGKLVFRVEDMQYAYVHVDNEIHEVKLDEIPDIVIPEGIEDTVPEIDPDGIFDVARVIGSRG